MSLKITPFYEPESGTWTYLLADSVSRSAAIIDPVWTYDPVSGRADSVFLDTILDRVEREKLTLEWVLETHAHADHLTAAGEIRRRMGARIACGQGICAVQKTFSKVFNMTALPTDGRQFDRLLQEGDRISLGTLEILVMETPGHTADGLSYRVGDAVFIGDTLFAPLYGTARCDFPGGNAGQLFDSIHRIHQLPDETRLFLCHDYPKAGEQPRSTVTVAESRSSNIHIKEETRREAYIEMRNTRDAQLGLPRLLMASLQVNIRAGEGPEADANGVAYLKTPFNKSLKSLLLTASENRDD